jgi:hypothetical protein
MPFERNFCSINVKKTTNWDEIKKKCKIVNKVILFLSKKVNFQKISIY